MSRSIIDKPQKDKTTVETSKLLMDRVISHVRDNGDTLTNFFTCALVNQLEKEGDFSIREELREENEE